MQKPIAMAPANAAFVRSSQQIKRDRWTGILSENTLQGAGTHRAGRRQTQALQTLALRCEKTAQNYASFVALALGFILIKSVHTT